MLKREALAKMGYGEEQKSMMLASQSLKQFDNRSNYSLVSSRGNLSLEPISKPKAIDYLQKAKEGKESVKDFINFSR